MQPGGIHPVHPRGTDNIDDRPAQHIRPRRLHQMRLDLQALEQPVVTHHVHRGEEYQRDVVIASVAADRLRHIDAVDVGHLVVDDDDVDRQSFGMSGFQNFKPGRPVGHREPIKAPHTQLLGDDPAIDGIVVDDEHPRILDRRRQLLLPPAFRDDRKRQLDRKRRTLADF